MSSKTQIDHIDAPDKRLGRCLLGCGRIVQYLEIDHARENFRGECPVCGKYHASVSEVEGACD